MRTQPFTIRYDPDHDWFVVTFEGNIERHYGSLKTLLGFIEDYYTKGALGE